MVTTANRPSGVTTSVSGVPGAFTSWGGVHAGGVAATSVAGIVAPAVGAAWSSRCKSTEAGGLGSAPPTVTRTASPVPGGSPSGTTK